MSYLTSKVKYLGFLKYEDSLELILGMKILVTLDNGLKIANLDVNYGENMFVKYQKNILKRISKRLLYKRH